VADNEEMEERYEAAESLHVWFRTSLGWKALPLFSQGQQAQ